MSKRIALLEADWARRAEIGRFLFQAGHHVEPFEDIAEFRDIPPKADVVLVNDERNNLKQLFEVLARDCEWCPVVAYASDPEVERVVNAMTLGVIHYLEWPVKSDTLERRLLDSIEGRNAYADLCQKSFEARVALGQLSDRQKEVLQGVARGLSNKEIACELNLSPRTVEIHRSLMNQKLREIEFGSAHEVAFYARVGSAGDVPPEKDDQQFSGREQTESER